MAIPLTGEQVLGREFLELRAKILELAAALDRLDRAGGVPHDDRRLALLRAGLEALDSQHPDRAEQVQLIFSRAYDDDWRENFRLRPR